MTTKEKLAMLRAAMDAIRQNPQLSQAAKARGLKCLEEAYARHTKSSTT